MRTWLTAILAFLLGAAAPQIGRPAPGSPDVEHACDRLAALPTDTNKVGPGVGWKLLDPKLAVPACEAAVRDQPDVPRFKFQYARALTKAGDYEKAVKLFRELAERQYAAAQVSLGHMYVAGRGVPKDDAEAMRWYRKAAEQGNATGQLYLGHMYAEGKGIPKDDAEAVRWYRRAAEQDNATAQLHLGIMYAEGRGIPKDDAEAVRWYRRAAEQGDPLAKFFLLFLTGKHGESR